MSIFEIPPLNWAIFILVNLLLLSSAYCLSSRFLKGLTYFSGILMAAGMVYLSEIILIVLFFGVVVHTFDAIPVGVISSVLSIVIIATQWRGRLPFWPTIMSSILLLKNIRDPWFWLFFILLVLQLVLLLVKVYIVPVHILDSMAYRAIPAPMWYQMGYIPSVLDVPANEVNGRSLSIALLMLWYFLFLGVDLFVNLPQYIVSIIFILAVYAISRQCGIGRAQAFKVATLVYFMPVILMQSISTQDHLAINTAFLASLFLLRECFLRKALRFIPFIGITIGLMFAFKNNAVVYMPILIGAGLWLFYQHKKTHQIARNNIYSFAKFSSVGVILMVLIGGYWTIKNMAVYGDPFGLLFSSSISFSTKYVETLDEKDEIQRAYLSKSAPPENIEKTAFSLMVFNALKKTGIKLTDGLSTFFYRVSDVGNALYIPTLEKISGYGPQFFTFGLAALFILILSVFRLHLRTEASFYAVVASCMLLLYFCIMNNEFAYRNFIFFPALLLIYFFSLFANTGKENTSKTFVNGLNIFVLACLVWSGFFTLMPANVNPLIFKEFVMLESHYQSPGRYLRKMNESKAIMRRMDEIPPTEEVAYINARRRNSWSYAFNDVNWRRKATYIPLYTKYFNCESNKALCYPTTLFKEVLLNKKIAFVNLCFFPSCIELSDSDFIEIGEGLYYFKGSQ